MAAAWHRRERPVRCLTIRIGGRRLLPEIKGVLSESTENQAGWLALVFTDVESSTQLWQVDEDAFSWALMEHDLIVREALSHHDGAEVKHTGDGFFLTFATPLDSVRFAVELMNRMAGHTWPSSLGPIRARIGINWGPARRFRDDYRSAAVNLAARICEAACGGQVLLSTAVLDALGGHPEFAHRTRYICEAQLAGIRGGTDLFELMLPETQPAVPAVAPATAPDELVLSTAPEDLDEAELWQRAREALEQNQHDAALTWLIGLFDRGPDDPRVLASLGVAFAAARKFDRAEHCLRRSVEQAPRDASVWYNLARVYGKMGRRDRLAWALSHALQADPEHTKARDAARKYGVKLD